MCDVYQVLLLYFILLLTLSTITLGILLAYLIRPFFPKKQDYLETSEHEAILITGCDSGIGLELAKYFHKTTKYKIICGLLDEESDAYNELSELNNSNENDRIQLTKLDLRSDSDVNDLKLLIDDSRKRLVFRNLVAIINNAGTLVMGEFPWLTWKQIQSQIEINFMGTLRLTNVITPYIIESKGRIINVSSVNDATVFPGLTVYSATKSALSTFSRGLGYELRKFGVHVVTIRLGDFARLTNIMSRHKSNQADMWNKMSSENKIIYKDYFHEFNDYLGKYYGKTSPNTFGESSLFTDFRRAVLSKNPPATITCAPISFKLFYFFIELMPVGLQYYLLDFLIQRVFGFHWKPPKQAS